MLSFNFVKVYGLFEWKRICAGFFFFFFSFYVLTLEIQLSRRGGWGVIKRFNLATFFLCLFQSRIWISNVPCRSVSSIKIRRECVFLYWWKWWPSLFTLSLYNSLYLQWTDWWCNGQCNRLACGRLLVRASVWSHQTLCNWYLLLLR
jgi:hypothetical protein